MRAAVVLGSLAASALCLAGSATAAEAPWRAAGELRLALSDAEAAQVMGDGTAVGADLAVARRAAVVVLARRPADLRAALAALAAGDRAAAAGNAAGLAVARATVWTAVLRAAAAEAIRAARGNDVSTARSWLLVREFRPPTRFSRAAADATLALDGLAAGRLAAGQAAAALRADLFDTYDGRLRSALAGIRDAERLGFDTTRAEMGALTRGYWEIVAPAYRAQRGAAAERTAASDVQLLVAAAAGGSSVAARLARVESALEGFRAAPLSADEQLRRAGQLERFLKLVPIEYGRGVRDGRVTLSFEVQEAITFADGAAAAFRDLEPVLLRRDAAATRRLGVVLGRIGDTLADAERGRVVASPDHVSASTDEALGLAGRVYPAAWREAAKTADFDVIAATLDRLQAAAASGEWGRAESARLEAYGIFELGPEQRLRGLAPSLFQAIEGYFWYGEDGHPGLVQLVKRKASAAELAATRAALDDALQEAEERIGAGPGSTFSIVSNSAVIVFREGLEAVLILAALMASMVGPERRYRRPLLAGAAVALGASALTWVVAQTILGSLAGFGERLEAIVSLVAIGVLLVILNWFYHRVYWTENLQGLHRRKKTILTGAGVTLAAAQVAGLVALGFTSVYREGFETVLFLQALTLEAGAFTVLEGVALGFAATLVVGVAVFVLERRLPHRKMLIATGILITWVLVVLVGQTVQTMQKVGWVPVTPIEGLQLPYWSGVWLGVYPTWEGLLAQAAAATLVVGSYFGAEAIRGRRRARILGAPLQPRETETVGP
jgi:high-affinity iron transporter